MVGEADVNYPCKWIVILCTLQTLSANSVLIKLINSEISPLTNTKSRGQNANPVPASYPSNRCLNQHTCTAEKQNVLFQDTL